jgi:hypothetical protein
MFARRSRRGRAANFYQDTVFAQAIAAGATSRRIGSRCAPPASGLLLLHGSQLLLVDPTF